MTPGWGMVMAADGAAGWGGDYQSHAPFRAPARTAAAPSLLPMWLRRVVASLLPYLRGVQSWVCDGRIHDRAGEMLFAADETIPRSDAEAHWKHGFALRPAEAIPSVFRPIADDILLAGQSRHLLNRMQSHRTGMRARPGFNNNGEVVAKEGEGGGGSGRRAMSGDVVFPLDAAFCDALTHALYRGDRLRMAAAAADPTPSAARTPRDDSEPSRRRARPAPRGTAARRRPDPPLPAQLAKAAESGGEAAARPSLHARGRYRAGST